MAATAEIAPIQLMALKPTFWPSQPPSNEPMAEPTADAPMTQPAAAPAPKVERRTPTTGWAMRMNGAPW